MHANSFSAQRRSRISALRFFALFVLAFIAIPRARAQQPDFSAVAVQAAHAVEESKSDSVVVLDFVGPGTFVSELGRDLADQFSAGLASAGGKFAVVDRAIMRQAIESNRFAPEIISDPEIATWLAKNVGAASGISGRLSVEGISLQLTIDCFGVKDGTISGSFHATFSLTDEWSSQLAKNIDPDAGVTNLSKLMKPPDWLGPRCMVCPKPPFTQAALDKKYQGTVVMFVVIGKDGQARDFRITKSLPNGLTLTSVQAVQNWTFDPAKGPDGMRVDMRVPIEVMFRLYK